MRTAIIGFDVVYVDLHIGVGFGVARFDKQAMPEPQNVGRVTGRFPRFFVSIAINYLEPLSAGSSAWIFCDKLNKKDISLIIGAFALGIICATWPEIWANETAETIMAASLLVSIIALVISSYFTTETALEIRGYNKKKLFSDYCARFSNDQNIKNVAEWLLAITEMDSNGNIRNVHFRKLKNDKKKTIMEPTPFEIERFWSFLIELVIQIKNGKLEREDVRKIFSSYAQLFDYVQQTDDKTSYYKYDRKVIAELLCETTN